MLKIRDKMADLSAMVRGNMKAAQAKQKVWYDKTARHCGLNPGERVLILLPISDTGLLAKWQGPYIVNKKINQTTYEIMMPDHKKGMHSFHINMLRKWHERELVTAHNLWIRALGE